MAVDIIDNNQAIGNVAGFLLNKGRFDVGTMRPWVGEDGKSYVTVYKGGDPKKPESYQAIPIQTNATLRRDEWKQLDEAVQMAARSRLGGVQDLIDNGLVFNLNNGLGTTVLETHSLSDELAAAVTMDGVTRSIQGRAEFKHTYLPLPIIHVDYEINARILNASRSLGNPLDTTQAEMAARRIMETIETMLFTSYQYSFGETDSNSRNSIYGFLNFPDRNQVTLTKQWTASNKTAAEILNDVMNMKQALINDKFFGPYILYVPTAYEVLLDKDYSSSYAGVTIRDRIKQISGIKDVKVSDFLPAHNVILVQMTSDVVRLVQGMPIQNVEWQQEGNMLTRYKVMTIQVPQIRSDYNGNCGIAHLA